MDNSLLYKFKKNVSNIGVYLLASLIPMGINLLINPLIALNMSPEDYAIVGFYTSFNSLLSPLISFYAFSFYTKRYFELDKDELVILKSTILQSLIFLSLLLALISLLGIYVYMQFFNNDSSTPFLPYAFLSVFTLPLTGIVTLKLVDYKMQKKSKSFFKLSVAKGLTLAVLSVLLVVVFKFGATGKLTAAFVATFVFFIYLIYQDQELIKRKIDWKVFKSMLRFVWPLIIGAMLHFFTNGYDRISLERLGNQNELGFYVVAVQVVSYIGVFQTAISNTFQPDIYKAVIKRNWRNATKYISVILASTLLIIIVFIILAPYLIDLLTAGKYTYSAKYARILAFSQLTATMYYVTTDLTIVLGYTRLSLLNKIVGVILTVIVYSIFISNWSFTGAAWGQVTSYLIMMIINITFLFFWHKRVTNIKNLNSQN